MTGKLAVPAPGLAPAFVLPDNSTARRFTGGLPEP